MSARLMERGHTRPSLRQLAEAADVTVPTLRHYFGSRDDLVAAVLAEIHRLGGPALERVAEPQGDLEASVRDYLTSLAHAMHHRGLGDKLAIGFIEGLLNGKLGPEALAHLIDPSVDALEERLRAHQARGEMIDANPRHAAIFLLSPVVLACHHQDQMFGRTQHPLDVAAFIDDLACAFVKAYGARHEIPAADGSARPALNRRA
jgi:AcrR family transcriptional regulator